MTMQRADSPDAPYVIVQECPSASMPPLSPERRPNHSTDSTFSAEQNRSASPIPVSAADKIPSNSSHNLKQARAISTQSHVSFSPQPVNLGLSNIMSNAASNSSSNSPETQPNRSTDTCDKASHSEQESLPDDPLLQYKLLVKPWWIGQRLCVTLEQGEELNGCIRDYFADTRCVQIWYENERGTFETVSLRNLIGWNVIDTHRIDEYKTLRSLKGKMMDYIPRSARYRPMRLRLLQRIKVRYSDGEYYAAFVDGFDPLSRRHHINYGDQSEWMWSTSKRIKERAGRLLTHMEDMRRRIEHTGEYVKPIPWDAKPYGLDASFARRSREMCASGEIDLSMYEYCIDVLVEDTPDHEEKKELLDETKAQTETANVVTKQSSVSECIADKSKSVDNGESVGIVDSKDDIKVSSRGSSVVVTKEAAGKIKERLDSVKQIQRVYRIPKRRKMVVCKGPGAAASGGAARESRNIATTTCNNGVSASVSVYRTPRRREKSDSGNKRKHRSRRDVNGNVSTGDVANDTKVAEETRPSTSPTVEPERYEPKRKRARVGSCNHNSIANVPPLPPPPAPLHQGPPPPPSVSNLIYPLRVVLQGDEWSRRGSTGNYVWTNARTMKSSYNPWHECGVRPPWQVATRFRNET